MQKKIIALAVAGLMSGAAFAQSNVTVYGLVDVGYGYFSGTETANGSTVGVAGNSPSINRISSNQASGSRLGFRGTEDLGNGLKATFVAEAGINADGGAASQGTGTTGLEGGWRQMFAGLQGSFGSVLAGRQYNPFWEVAAAVDPFGTVGVASSSVIHPVGLASVARTSSSIKYVSPNFNGLNFSALYGMGEKTSTTTAGAGAVAGACWDASATAVTTIAAAGGCTAAGDFIITPAVAAGAATPTLDPRTFSMSLVYANGPLVAGLAYINLNDGAGVGTDVKSTAIGGTYDFGMAKVSVLYNKLNATNNVVDHGDWHLGATFPMGMHTFRVAYNRANDKTAANQDASHWGLGYQYNMSKRTNFYAMYGKVSNKNGAGYAVTATSGAAALGGTGAADDRTGGLTLGMRHSF